MRNLIFSLIVILLCSPMFGEKAEELIKRADTAAENGNLKEAVEILEQGAETYPDSADIYAKWGLYLSKQAAEASLMKAGMLSDKSYKQLNKALELKPGHVKATLYRGILGVNMPKFLGKLKQGIIDLEKIRNEYGSNPDLYMVSTYYLGIGYQKNEEIEKAAECFKFVTLYGKQTSFYEDAKEQYESLAGEREKETGEDHYKLGMKYLEDNDLNNAVIHLRQAAKEQENNLELHLIFLRALGTLAEEGYDETIQDNTSGRSELAQEVFDELNHCVEIAPDNDEIRFLRGSVGIDLPFFTNSLDTSISDLSYLAENGKSEEMKTKAGSLLKRAEEKKEVYDLAEKGYEAETMEEKRALKGKFIPTDSPVHQEEPEGDHMKIELVLGYRDQIQPQTAVWVEDMEGNYLATLYVSGFAASVKEKQMHLPQWAENSQFRDIASITGASIDCGKHIFYWDFIDHNGNKFAGTKFVIKTELCHWPHVQYTQQSLPVNLDKGTQFSMNGDDYLIYKLSATCVSR